MLIDIKHNYDYFLSINNDCPNLGWCSRCKLYSDYIYCIEIHDHCLLGGFLFQSFWESTTIFSYLIGFSSEIFASTWLNTEKRPDNLLILFIITVVTQKTEVMNCMPKTQTHSFQVHRGFNSQNIKVWYNLYNI